MKFYGRYQWYQDKKTRKVGKAKDFHGIQPHYHAEKYRYLGAWFDHENVPYEDPITGDAIRERYGKIIILNREHN